MITPVPRRHRALGLQGRLEIQGPDRLDQRRLLPDAEGRGEYRAAARRRGGDGDRHRRPEPTSRLPRRCAPASMPSPKAAPGEGITHITAGNYGGNLGPASFPSQGDRRVSALDASSFEAQARSAARPVAADRRRGSKDLKPKDIEAIAIGTTRERLTVGDAVQAEGHRRGQAPLRRHRRTLRQDRAGAHRGRDRRRRRRRRLSRRRACAAARSRSSGIGGVLAGASMRGGTIDIAGDAGERAGGVAVGEAHGMRGGGIVDRRQGRRASRRAHAARADDLAAAAPATMPAAA